MRVAQWLPGALPVRSVIVVAVVIVIVAATSGAVAVDASRLATATAAARLAATPIQPAEVFADDGARGEAQGPAADALYTISRDFPTTSPTRNSPPPDSPSRSRGQRRMPRSTG